jgi:hypothetical protein
MYLEFYPTVDLVICWLGSDVSLSAFWAVYVCSDGTEDGLRADIREETDLTMVFRSGRKRAV